jgi:hypothetical protein
MVVVLFLVEKSLTRINCLLACVSAPETRGMRFQYRTVPYRTEMERY